MGELFGSMYCLFEDMFGIDLANYLWGQATVEQQSNMFIGIGWSMIGVSLFMMILYYYIINVPRLCNWWGWLIFFSINGILNLLIGWRWVLSDLYAGKMMTVDVVTNQKVALQISEGNTFSFGLANMILSFMFFGAFTYLFKWKSSNCWPAPENIFYKKLLVSDKKLN